MRTLATLMVSFGTALAVLPVPSSAQSVVLGAVGGPSYARLVQDRAGDSEERSGFTAGAFVEVQTPVPLLRVLAEAAWIQRGGRYPTGGWGVGGGEVTADYVAVTVAPTVMAGVGALSVFAYGGPSVELHVRTRASADVAAVYREPAPQLFAVSAGVGFAIRVSGWEVRGETRQVEGLSRAYAHDEGDFRHRATEVLVRLGRTVTR